MKLIWISKDTRPIFQCNSELVNSVKHFACQVFIDHTCCFLLLTCKSSLQCNFSNTSGSAIPISPDFFPLFSKQNNSPTPNLDKNVPVIFNFAQTIWYVLLNKLCVSYHSQLITKAGEVVHFTAVRNNSCTRWPSKFQSNRFMKISTTCGREICDRKRALVI